MSVLCECCVVRSLRRADPLSRGVLQTVVCLTECGYENLNLRKPGLTGAVEL